jgi:hypothetical protein
MVIVFSGNRRPSKKREKFRMVNGEGIFRYLGIQLTPPTAMGCGCPFAELSRQQ